jgi:hypothetical protein
VIGVLTTLKRFSSVRHGRAISADGLPAASRAIFCTETRTAQELQQDAHLIKFPGPYFFWTGRHRDNRKIAKCIVEQCLHLVILMQNKRREALILNLVGVNEAPAPPRNSKSARNEKARFLHCGTPHNNLVRDDRLRSACIAAHQYIRECVRRKRKEVQATKEPCSRWIHRGCSAVEILRLKMPRQDSRSMCAFYRYDAKIQIIASIFRRVLKGSEAL